MPVLIRPESPADAPAIFAVTEAAFRTAVPSVYQPHDLQHMHHPEFFSAAELYWRNLSYPAWCAQAALVVMMTGWGKRDFARPADDPANAYFRGTVQRWGALAPHVWVWDYAFSVGASELGLPYPTPVPQRKKL